MCRLHALQDIQCVEQSNSTVTSFLRRCRYTESTAQHPTPNEFTWKGNKYNHKNNSVYVWGWGACRHTNRCQSELLSLSPVSALSNLSSTWAKLGALFVCLRGLILPLCSVPAALLCFAWCWLSASQGEELADNDLWEMHLHFPIFPPPSALSNRAGLLALPSNSNKRITCSVMLLMTN